MYPRLAPSNEYFPAPSPENANRPSSRVIIHLASRRFFVFTSVTRVSMSGVPVVELTTTPATLNPDVAAGFMPLGSCAATEEEAQNMPQTARSIPKSQFRITICMFTRFQCLGRGVNVRFGPPPLATAGPSTHISALPRRSRTPDLPAGDRKQSPGTRQAVAGADGSLHQEISTPGGMAPCCWPLGEKQRQLGCSARKCESPRA